MGSHERRNKEQIRKAKIAEDSVVAEHEIFKVLRHMKRTGPVAAMWAPEKKAYITRAKEQLQAMRDAWLPVYTRHAEIPTQVWNIPTSGRAHHR